MSCETEEVRELSAILNEKLNSCTEVWSVKTIENALNVINEMNVEYSEVRLLLKVLIDKIKLSGKVLKDSKLIEKTLTKLKSMNSSYPEVVEALEVLEK